MKNLIERKPAIAEAFFNLTAAIRESSKLTARENELILVGIFTANQALTGLVTHLERALEQGATEEEIISAISLALPVCGIASVNMALDKAIQIFTTKKV